MTKLTVKDTRTMIRVAVETAEANGYRGMSVAILDDGGNLLAFERADGTAPGRFTIAKGKAYGAVMLGMPGSVQMARAESQAYFIGAANGAFGGQLIPLPGGILIKDADGVVVGAMGITGDLPEYDEIAGLAGIEAAGFVGAA